MSKGEKKSFSDEKLFQFHSDFTGHVTMCEKRFVAGELQFKELITTTSKNTDTMTTLIDETRELVQLYKDVQGAARVGKQVQSVGVWLLKWPLIGGGLYAIFNWAIEHLPDPFL